MFYPKSSFCLYQFIWYFYFSFLFDQVFTMLMIFLQWVKPNTLTLRTLAGTSKSHTTSTCLTFLELQNCASLCVLYQRNKKERLHFIIPFFYQSYTVIVYFSHSHLEEFAHNFYCYFYIFMTQFGHMIHQKYFINKKLFIWPCSR